MNADQTERKGYGILRKENGEVEVAHYDKDMPTNLVKIFSVDGKGIKIS